MRTKELIDLSPEILISRLREYITKYKLRQIDIANILGVSPGTLSRYLNNQRYPSRELANEKVVIEYDGAYWHKDKAERDKTKTKALEKAGWTVVRVREKPLKVLSRKYNVSSKTGEYKETANKVLKKLNQLGYEVKGLDKYLERKTLVNKKEAEKYIDKLLKEKNKK